MGPGGTDMPEDCAWIDDIYFPTMDEITGNVTIEVMEDWNIIGMPVLTDDTFYTLLHSYTATLINMNVDTCPYDCNIYLNHRRKTCAC